jgi:hypothetical protein
LQVGGIDRVIAIGSTHARGRASRVEVDIQAALVAEPGGDRRIVRARTDPDVNEALEAVGLSSRGAYENRRTDSPR